MQNILIITGGSRGLGLGIAQYYHEKGYRVFSIARNRITKFYAVEQLICDLSNPSAIEKTMHDVFNFLDKEEINSITLINNAGKLGPVNTIENLEAGEIENTINVNLTAPLTLCASFIKFTNEWHCIKKIINISSGAAVTPYASWSLYCSSKSGLDMLTRVIAKEQKDLKYGVSISSVYPGIVDTDMQEEARNAPKEHFKAVQRFIDFYEHGELTSPKEVAEKIYSLDTGNQLKNGSIIDVRNT